MTLWSVAVDVIGTRYGREIVSSLETDLMTRCLISKALVSVCFSFLACCPGFL